MAGKTAVGLPPDAGKLHFHPRCRVAAFWVRRVARSNLVIDGRHEGLPMPICVRRLFTGFCLILSIPLGVLGVLGG